MGRPVRHAVRVLCCLCVALPALGCSDMVLRAACAAADVPLTTQNAADPATLPAPGDLSGRYISGTTVRITWKDNSETETGFGIQRSVQGKDYVLVAFVGPDVTTCDNSYTEGGLPLYRVYAVNAEGKYSMSDPLTTLTPLGKEAP